MYTLLPLATILVTSSMGVPLGSRIIGGENTTIENYPYMLSVELDDIQRVFCGGSVITKDYALTAAQCVYNANLTSIKIRSGSSTLFSGGTVHYPSKIILHPEFNKYEYDIAIVKVSNPFDFGETVQPIPLTTKEPHPGEIGTITGWGHTTYLGSRASQLQVVFIPIITRESCDWSYQGIYPQITTNMLCAGLDVGGKDACWYDGGGPLTIAGKLAGIISWGYQCALAEYPGVYTNIAPLRNFVVNITGVE